MFVQNDECCLQWKLQTCPLEGEKPEISLFIKNLHCKWILLLFLKLSASNCHGNHRKISSLLGVHFTKKFDIGNRVSISCAFAPILRFSGSILREKINTWCGKLGFFNKWWHFFTWSIWKQWLVSFIAQANIFWCGCLSRFLDRYCSLTQSMIAERVSKLPSQIKSPAFPSW